MKYYFIINPKAGKKHGDVLSVIRKCAGRAESEQKGKEKIEWKAVFTERAGHAEELASAAVKAGYDIVIAAGGDGTIQETAKGVIGSGADFGLLPCGSGNGLARNLSIPLDIEAATEGVFKWKAKSVDAGFANGKLFLVSCGIGLDAEVAHCFNSQSHGRGILPYVWHALRIYFSYRPAPVPAVIDGRKHVLEGLIITALIGEQYGGGAKIAPRAVVDDGLLDLCTVKPVNTLRLLMYLPELFKGTLDRHGDISEDIRCRKFSADCGGPFWFHLDGEDFHCETGKLEVHIAPAALNIIRP